MSKSPKCYFRDLSSFGGKETPVVGGRDPCGYLLPGAWAWCLLCSISRLQGGQSRSPLQEHGDLPDLLPSTGRSSCLGFAGSGGFLNKQTVPAGGHRQVLWKVNPSLCLLDQCRTSALLASIASHHWGQKQQFWKAELMSHLGGEGKTDWATVIKHFREETSYLCDTSHCLFFGVPGLGREQCCTKAGTHSSVHPCRSPATRHVLCSPVS